MQRKLLAMAVASAFSSMAFSAPTPRRSEEIKLLSEAVAEPERQVRQAEVVTAAEAQRLFMNRAQRRRNPGRLIRTMLPRRTG